VEDIAVEMDRIPPEDDLTVLAVIWTPQRAGILP
jgi:hypothetical protein